jgi:hypothetical protein
MGIEKRKDTRFSVQEDVIVALQNGFNGFNRIGKVKDISMGGLSFEHIYDEDLDLIHSRENIFLWVSDFSMSKIPCSVVYNITIPMPPEYDSIPVYFITRRCGLQFETLTEYQIEQLDFFLKTYSKGKA